MWGFHLLHSLSTKQVFLSISLIGKRPVSFPHHVLSFLKVTYCHGPNCISEYTYEHGHPVLDTGSSAWLIYQRCTQNCKNENKKAVYLSLKNFWLQSLQVPKKRKKIFSKNEVKLYRRKQKRKYRILKIDSKDWWKKVSFKRQYLLDMYIYSFRLCKEVTH